MSGNHPHITLTLHSFSLAVEPLHWFRYFHSPRPGASSFPSPGRGSLGAVGRLGDGGERSGFGTLVDR